MKHLLAWGVSLCVLAGSAQANLLTNGDFEDGPTQNTGDGVPGWSTWGFSGWHHDDAGQTLDTKAIKFWWDDAGIFQDFTVTGGDTYDFSVQVLNASTDPLVGWNGLIKAEFYNSSIGTDPSDALANVELQRYFSASDPIDQWVEIGGSLQAPAGADIGRIVMLIVDWQSTGVSGALNFDNAVVTPEPGALALLMIGGLVALRRR